MRERGYKHTPEQTKTSSRKETLIASAAIAGAIMVPIGVGAVHTLSKETVPVIKEVLRTPEEIAAAKAAAYEIAHKYKSCAITEVTDLHTIPENGDKSRTTLLLTLDVERNPDAADALVKYDNGSNYAHNQDVRWTNPELTASVEFAPGMYDEVHGPDGLSSYEIPDSDMATDGSDPHADNQQFTVKIHPRATQPRDDVEMTFTVTTNAQSMVSEEQPIVAKTQCVGTAVYDRSVSSWVLK